jgi:hypothetical protein
MKKILLSAIAILLISSSFSQVLVSSGFLRNYTKSQMSSVYPENDIAMYIIRYKTNDIDGNLDTASGAVMIPLNRPCAGYPLVNYNHGTVFDKMAVPSRMQEVQAGQLWASHGFISTMPDYLGMGDARGLHPYQHAESEATATVDFIRASREFLQQQNITLNGEVYLTGYSQGGHAAMSTHKYIQDNNLYTEFNILGSIPMSGAYDMSGITADTIFSGAYSNPGYIVYLINSMQMAYDNLYDSVQQYFKAPYSDDIQGWVDGTHSLASINNSFPDSIHLFLEDSVYQGFLNNPNHPLKLDIQLSDVYAWAPTRPINMYYCTADEQVHYKNSLKALDTMNAKGATNVIATSSGALSHGGCVLPSFINGYSHIAGIATVCPAPVGIDEASLNSKIVVFPNPANNGAINYSSELNIKNIELYNQLGQKVWNKNIENKKSLSVNISNVKSGIYHIVFTDEINRTTTKKLTIQNN